MFGVRVLPKLLGAVGSKLRDKKKKKVKGKLKKKKGMLKGSIKKRLTKRNKRKYGGFLGGKNLNKKGKPKKPPVKKVGKTRATPSQLRRLRKAGLTFPGTKRRRRGPRKDKLQAHRKLKPGTLKFKRHVDRKARL